MHRSCSYCYPSAGTTAIPIVTRIAPMIAIVILLLRLVVLVRFTFLLDIVCITVA
jgi:hypothetical protein